MTPTDTLRDMWAHHAWADAEHWRAFEAFPAALKDAALFERLHHLHLTQSAWVWAISDRRLEFVFTKPGDFTAEALKSFARATTRPWRSLRRRRNRSWSAGSASHGLLIHRFNSAYVRV